MKNLKRIAAVVIALVVVVVGGFVAMMASVFSGNAPLPETGPIAGGKALLIKDGYVSAYAAFVGDKHVVLIDCGNDVAATALLAALSAQQLTVDGIFLTHGHADHTNGCAAVRKAHPGAFLAAGAGDLPQMAGKEAFKGLLPRMFGKADSGLVVDKALVGGEDVAVGGQGSDLVGDGHVFVYAVPGHTAGSMAFVVNGVLFFGDAATGADDGHIKAPPGPFSDDQAEGVASLHALATKLAGVDLSTFAYAHGGPSPADLAKLSAVAD